MPEDLVFYASALRKRGYPLDQVLQLVKAVQPRVQKSPPHSRLWASILADDLYDPALVDHVSRELNIVAGWSAWNRATNNALWRAGALKAAAVANYAWTVHQIVIDSHFAINVVLSLVTTKFGFDRMCHWDYIEAALLLFWNQATNPAARTVSPKWFISYWVLVPVIASHLTVPNRWETMDRLLPVFEARGAIETLHPNPEVSSLILSIYGCRSHMDALRLVLESTASYPAEDAKKLFGRIVRIRHDDAPVMSSDNFVFFLRGFEQRFGIKDPALFTMYFKGVHECVTILRMPWERGHLHNHYKAPKDHLIEVAGWIERVAALHASEYADTVNVQMQTALLNAYGAVDSPAWEHPWAWLVANTRPIEAQSAAAALSASKTLDSARAVWAQFLESGGKPDIELYGRWIICLCRLQQYEEALDVVLKHIGDEPEHRSAILPVFIFAREADVPRLSKLLPRVWADPRTHTSVTFLREKYKKASEQALEAASAAAESAESSAPTSTETTTVPTTPSPPDNTG